MHSDIRVFTGLMPNPGLHAFLPGLDLNVPHPRVSWAGAEAEVYGRKLGPETSLWLDEGVDPGTLEKV